MFLEDLRFACRQIRLAPGFSLAVILTLALASGVNTAVFSLVDGFLLRKLPYPEPARVAALVVHRELIHAKKGQPSAEDDDSFDGGSWQILRENLTGVTLASWGGTNGVNLGTRVGSQGEARYVQNGRVSADYLIVLGIPPRLGRSFSPTEDSPHGPPAAILSDRLWRSAFKADEQIVGKAILLKGEPHTVVGVLPPNALTPMAADVFTPLQPATTGECGGNNCGILVRLKPGVSWEQVNTQLANIPAPREWADRAWIYARPLQIEYAGEQKDKVLVLLLAVSFILLIACANLAGLSMARVLRRNKEISTRLALGATPWAVLRQLWTESVVLALLGAVVGIFLAAVAAETADKFLPPEMIPIGGLAINVHVLAFTLVVAVVSSVAFGVMPALPIWKIDLRASMTESGIAGPGRSRYLRQALIAAEVALAIVLLSASGLLLRTLIHLETLPPRFDPHGVITAKVSLDDARYRQGPAFRKLMRDSVDSLRKSLGVSEVAVGLSLPYERGLNDRIVLEDGLRAGTRTGSSMAYVTPGYFSALRIPLLMGRAFRDSDDAASQPVAIVNRAFAQRVLRDLSPVGHHVQNSGITYLVVGMVGNVEKRPGMNPVAPLEEEPVLYLPANQIEQGLVNIAHIWFQPGWVVRAPGVNKAELARRMQAAIAAVDPGLPLAGIYSMDQILAEQIQQQRLEAWALGTLSVMALFLSALGIFSLVSNLVVQRGREIGIRIALGCTIRGAMLEVSLTGMVAALCGVAAGIAASFAVLRVLATEVYGVGVHDPLTLIAAPALVLCIASVASFWPTLRISRMDPAQALRAT